MEQELKPIPTSLKKTQIVKMYHPIPENTIRNHINEIIFDNRKDLKCNKDKTRKKIISSQYVWRNELLELIEILGLPKGYELPKK